MSAADLENRYYTFLRNAGYADADALGRVLAFYLPYFEGCSRVLDIGCGHGEFLELLQEDDHEAVGVDVDPAMVEACRVRGLTAHCADALEWLPRQAGAFDGIFSSNVVEHLAVPQVLALISASYGALRPGGTLLMGVPNPESIVVQLHEFWRDATHVRLYSRQLLEFILSDAGFTDVQSAENPAANWEGVEVLLASASPDRPNAPALPTLSERPVPPPLPRPVRRLKRADAYWESLRAELELQRGHSLAFSEWLHQALADLRVHLEKLEGAYRFLSPSREVFVMGHKPMSEESGK